MGRKFRIRAKDVAITAGDVVLEGEGAAVVAELLTQGHPFVLKGAQQLLDGKLKATDIRVDSSGRVMVQSARIQKLVFESLQNGGTLRDPRTLGRLVSRTGGRIGTYTIRVDEPDANRPYEKPHAPEDSESEDKPQKPPPLRGEADNQSNFMCRGEDGLDMWCGEFDDPTDEWDCNWFCGWDQY